MNRIQRLAEDVVNIIAAGEVVERPASAIKELLENSIDAGSDHIKVSVEEGGTKQISIVDNGEGIDIKDADLILERSATSKIKSEEDLETLYSYGFRGEALASISSISDGTEITSFRNKTGFKLSSSNGSLEIKALSEAGMGTTIELNGLFNKVPARKKFLKSESTELKHIKETFIQSAIPHTDIHFELFSNNSLIYRLPVTKDIYYRLYEIFGSNIAKNLIKNEVDLGKIKIKGFIGEPSLGKKNTKYQYIFINDRFVKSPLIHSAITQGYSGRMNRDFKPVYFIFIELDPKNFDINVHPRKLEVKFENESEIFRHIFQFTQKTLQKAEKDILAKNISDTPSFLVENKERRESLAKPKITHSKSNYTIKDSIKFSKSILEHKKYTLNKEVPKSPASKDNAVKFHRDGIQKQVLDSFIFVEHGKEIYLVDQAIASRQIKQIEIESKPQKTRLKIPKVISFNKISQKNKILDNIESINRFISIDDFGGESIQITEKTDLIPKSKIETILYSIANLVKITENDVIKIIIHESSAKRGERLSEDEVSQIAQHLEKLENNSFIKLDPESIRSLIKKNK